MAQKIGTVKVDVIKEASQDMQVLKIIVVVMGILIVLGLALVVYGLVSRAPNVLEGGKTISDIELKLPPGCVIAEAKGLDDRLIVRSDGPIERGCQQVIMIDMATGKILGRVLGSN